MRRLGARAAAILVLLLVVPVGSPAAATTTRTIVEDAADALRRDPLYVHPDAERRLDADDAADVRAALASSATPVHVAILPGAAMGADGADALLLELVDATGLDGTYALIAGDSFRAASNRLPRGRAGALATAALEAERERGTAAVLTDFIARVGAEAARTGGGGAINPGAIPDDGEDGGGTNLGPILLVGGAAAAAWFMIRGRRQRAEAARERARADAAARRMAMAELSVLGDDVLALEDAVRLHPEARPDYDAAVSRYRAARAALEYQDEPIDLVRVERVIAEGRYAMARVRARIDGRVLPEPPEELRRPGRHGEPPVELDEQGEPVYVGYRGPFASGWFGGGGLFSGLLLGSMLGWGWGDRQVDVHRHGDDGDFGSAGDFGDFGHFGGGDFGDFGGDLGGGDFGGGDF